MRFNILAGPEDVLAESPAVVITATGGLPNTGFLDHGAELVVSSWDIMSGALKPGAQTLLFDDNGAHPGMQAAELIAESGSELELVTPERFFAPEIGGLNHVPYARCFLKNAVRITINRRLMAVHREGNKLSATLGSDYSRDSDARLVDQIVVEHGTLPLDDLYFALKEGSRNHGEMDYQAVMASRPQQVVRNPKGRYAVFRIGDAVSSRNIHAAVYDALRLCKDL